MYEHLPPNAGISFDDWELNRDVWFRTPIAGTVQYRLYSDGQVDDAHAVGFVNINLTTTGYNYTDTCEVVGPDGETPSSVTSCHTGTSTDIYIGDVPTGPNYDSVEVHNASPYTAQLTNSTTNSPWTTQPPKGAKLAPWTPAVDDHQWQLGGAFGGSGDMYYTLTDKNNTKIGQVHITMWDQGFQTPTAQCMPSGNVACTVNYSRLVPNVPIINIKSA
ncbi:hypothetical protein ACFVJ4_37345 [Streptomyces sp. NPDC127178]|uniref:hypothetical protein n=1 Tax=unclassified Streptomyces TaxID=2593676 RepID=UPI003631591C